MKYVAAGSAAQALSSGMGGTAAGPFLRSGRVGPLCADSVEKVPERPAAVTWRRAAENIIPRSACQLNKNASARVRRQLGGAFHFSPSPAEKAG